MKMLDDPGPRSQPMKDALFETLCEKEQATAIAIPRYIKKSQGMLRRKANAIREARGEEQLPDIA